MTRQTCFGRTLLPHWSAGLAALALLASHAAPVGAQAVNDYPTNARAEYVFACMAANGQTRDMLDRCSCAVDRIAEVLPYRDYVSAETVLRMRQTTGERAGMFRGMAALTETVATLRRAEAEAEIICF
ncbi:hypothetical protein [Paracoccus beibuensis]|uniref:hypothetical protein n=1 Tax=Paracoccus beibuensis TaxID=547602 RepID=UPI00223EB319|nr:hypothetical protein [Paracoccus beibuensis]